MQWVIQPLSEEFIYASAEYLSQESYRLTENPADEIDPQVLKHNREWCNEIQ